MILLRGGFEGGGDHRPWGLEQRGEEVVEVETALPCGADDAGEDLLGLRATLRAIAATDLAIDHGGPDGVLGSPVGRVDVDGPEEGEHGREFAVEMGGEALRRGQGGCRVDKPSQAGEEAAAGDGEAMLGDRLRIAPIAERQGGGQDGLHAGGPGGSADDRRGACDTGAADGPDSSGAARS